MQVDGWNHNTHYHDTLLAAVPPRCVRALDVGCGIGTFARRLAAVSPGIDAIDRDAAIIARARALTGPSSNIRFIAADFIDVELERGYDFVSMIAVLHHLPFREALEKSNDLLRPGGVLAILGLDRASSWMHECGRSLCGYPLSVYYRTTRHRSLPGGASIREPTMTLPEIRAQAAMILPGSLIRRHVLWRYSLIWTKPVDFHARG